MRRAERMYGLTAPEHNALREARIATLPGDDLVTLAKPGEGNVTLYATAGPIRFLEGRARVPLAVARELAGPGWSVEP